MSPAGRNIKPALPVYRNSTDTYHMYKDEHYFLFLFLLHLTCQMAFPGRFRNSVFIVEIEYIHIKPRPSLSYSYLLDYYCAASPMVL